MAKAKKQTETKHLQGTHYAIAMERVEGGWVCIKYTLQDGQFVAAEYCNEPDMKAIALEKFKITAVRTFDFV